MKIKFVLVDDNGVEQVVHTADAAHPTSYKTHPERPMKAGEYEWFGFTFQPHVRLANKAGGY